MRTRSDDASKPIKYLVIADGGPHGLFKVEGSFSTEREATEHCNFCQHQYSGRWLVAAEYAA
jgi:hypothetical protein